MQTRSTIPERRRVARWTAAVAVGLAAMVTPGPAPRAEPAATDEQVTLAANVEMVKGHLFASRQLYARRQDAWAAVHAAHPVQELWSAVRGPLEAASPELASTLAALLERPERELDARVPEPRYRATVETVSAALDEALARAVPAPVRASPGFWTRVVVALLRHVAEEYAEAVETGKVAQVIEYQDAYGFFHRARLLFRARAGGGPSGEARAKRVEGAWLRLGRAFPDVLPPSRPVPAAEVERAVGAIVTELTRTGPAS
jgi:hypothetical protein